MSKFAGLALETEKPFRVLLRRPDDGAPVRDMQGVQAYIDVLSLDSRKANELERKAIDKRLSGEKATAEALEEAGDERLAALTVGWYLVGLNRARSNCRSAPQTRSKCMPILPATGFANRLPWGRACAKILRRRRRRT
jgi:hypothetical protein